MSIRVTCDECSATLSVGSQHAGKLAKCKACGAKVRIPDEGDDDDSGAIRLSRPITTPDPDQVAPPSVRAKSSEKKPAVKKRPPARSRSEGGVGAASVLGTVLIVIVAVAFRAVRVWNAVQRNQQGNQQQQADFGGGASNPPPASAPASFTPDASSSQLYSLTDSPIQPPKFDASTFREVPTTTGKGYVQSIATKGASPYTLMMMGVYLPAGVHQPGSLPCVLFSPAGTPLIHGNPLDGNPMNPEFLPYLEAGYAVVEFSLDGWFDSEKDSEAKLAAAFRQFNAAGAGVKNADAAFRFAQTNLPMVNPNQIYIAGHSSAGTLALLYAAHQPRLAGCIAYAPQVNVEDHLREGLNDPRLERELPGIRAFVKRSSPIAHVNQIRVPVLAFHSTGDTVTSCAATRDFCDRLKQAGGDVTFIEAPGNDHYQTMISPGLQRGVDWLAARVRSGGNPAVDATNIAAQPAQPATPDDGSSPFKPRRPAMAAADDTGSPFKPKQPEAGGASPFKLKDLGDGSTPIAANPPAMVDPATRQMSPHTPPLPSAEPALARKIDAQSKPEVGARVLATRGLRWVGAEVVEHLPDERIRVHYLQLPPAFDTDLPWTHVRIPVPASEISKDDMETVRFNLMRIPQGGEKAAEAAAETALLEVDGYIPKSLEVDVRNKRLSVMVVRGRASQHDVMIALMRSQLPVIPFTPMRRN
ncbi:hypothetical protein AYO47_01250 [Planctomyces sp. SCGC AG-212-M04]|nr:hypothetical protein AYO47_01250 [Planctomyces sp. SCGC AG-212-M04]